MTQIEIPQETLPLRPAAPAEPAGVVEQRPSVGRLVGVDLARALAVFGMFAVHVGPSADDVSGVGGWLLKLAEGRSSVLFATLAGFSLMLLAGRREPKTGLADRQATARIAIRAVILLALGTALTMLHTGIQIILAFYAVYFLLALPLVRLRAKTLAIIAGALAVAGPLGRFGVQRLLNIDTRESINAYDPLAMLGGDGLLSLLFDGTYPAITWMPVVIAGMALGRLDLAAGSVQRRLAVLGPALIALGYGTSWLAFKLIPPLRAIEEAQAADVAAGSASALFDAESLDPAVLDLILKGADEASLDALLEQVKTVDRAPPTWVDLMGAGPHTGTTFDILGSLGVAITVLVCATVIMARLAWLRRLAGPLVAVGTMSLTVYVAHVVAYRLLPVEGMNTFVALFGFIAAAIVFAVIWSRYFRRGPLEYLLTSTTKMAGFVR